MTLILGEYDSEMGWAVREFGRCDNPDEFIEKMHMIFENMFYKHEASNRRNIEKLIAEHVYDLLEPKV
ncbi:MAG: hypothetical protein GF334_09625 [Candidatus Altiarchaeales archaeon]|nr:hypothetical protein [Candidatus Altiarchaeales archaeon]